MKTFDIYFGKGQAEVEFSVSTENEEEAIQMARNSRSFDPNHDLIKVEEIPVEMQHQSKQILYVGFVPPMPLAR